MELIETLDTLLEQREFEQVISHYQNLDAETQSNEVVKLKYADALRELKQTEHAVTVYGELIESSPELSWCYVGLAKTYQTTGDIENGITAVEHGIDACGKTTELQLTLAELLLESGQADNAMAIFEKLYQTNPQDRWICLGKLQSQIKNRKYIEAVTFAESLYEQQGLEPVLLNRHTEALSNCLYEQSIRKHFEFVLDKAKQFTALEPDTALRIAVSVSKMLSTADLVITIDQLKTKLPTSQQFAYALQASYLTLGANYAFNLLPLQSSSSELQQSLSLTYDIYVSSGHAKTYLQFTALINAPGPELVKHWFNALIRTGNVAESKKLLEQYTSTYPEIAALLMVYYYYAQDYAAVLHSASQSLEQHPHSPLPNEVLYSLVEAPNSTDIPTNVAAYYEQLLTNQDRLGLNERIFAASFEAINTFTRSSFGSHVATLLNHYQTGATEHTPPLTECHIPRNVIQFWNTRHKPPQIAAMCSTWDTAPGFHYECFSTLSAKEFIKEHFDNEHVSAFNRCVLPAEQSDFFRLCYLWVKGGIYADSDDILIGQLPALLNIESRLIVVKEPFGVGNNFIAAAPKHPIIGAALQRATETLAERVQIMTWFKTGPGLLINCLGEYIQWCNENDHVIDATVLAPQLYRKHVTAHASYPGKTNQSWVKFMQL